MMRCGGKEQSVARRRTARVIRGAEGRERTRKKSEARRAHQLESLERTLSIPWSLLSMIFLVLWSLEGKNGRCPKIQSLRWPGMDGMNLPSAARW